MSVSEPSWQGSRSTDNWSNSSTQRQTDRAARPEIPYAGIAFHERADKVARRWSPFTALIRSALGRRMEIEPLGMSALLRRTQDQSAMREGTRGKQRAISMRQAGMCRFRFAPDCPARHYQRDLFPFQKIIYVQWKHLFEQAREYMPTITRCLKMGLVISLNRIILFKCEINYISAMLPIRFFRISVDV